MKDQDPEYTAFLRAANKHARKIGVKVVADRYGCQKTHIYQVLNQDKPAGSVVRLKLAKACGFNTVSDLINSIKEDELDKKYPVEISDQETWEHFKVIKRFKNKGIALKMNQKLADLEESDQFAFIQVLAKLDTWIKEERLSNKEDTGTGEP